ncbi:MAG: Arc family DNA-binding protein [Oscillospiraceae bacterium]|nr:Arc family DNA-binding protein [Oscillospiraceae bacterium]
MATTKVQTGLRLEEDMLIKITYIAKRNRRSLNAQLEFLAQTCIEEYESAHGEIPISDEDRGLK